MSTKAKKAAKEIIKTLELKRDLVVVIPAGGLGGQMYPVTSAMPKALIPINTKPLLVQLLHQLDRSSVFQKCIVACNEWYPMIRDYLDVFCSTMSIECECQKTDKLPPAFLRELLSQERLSDPFVLHYSDVWITSIDWKWILQNYEHLKGKKGIIGMLLVSRCFNYPVGIVYLDPDGNLIREFKQKPQDIINGYANCAVAVLSKEFVEEYVDNGDVDVFDRAISKAQDKGRLAGFEVAGWHHFQQIRDWLRAQNEYYRHIPY